jgi:ketosteroid isomerase-like protein
MNKSETHSDLVALALNLISAAERGDGAETMALFNPDTVIWHNTDELTVSMADNLPASAVFATKVPNRRYEDVKVTPFDGGYIQQHRLVGKTIDGETFSLPACAIMHVRNGKIIRIDEYFDSAPLIKIGIDSWLPKD